MLDPLAGDLHVKTHQEWSVLGQETRQGTTPWATIEPEGNLVSSVWVRAGKEPEVELSGLSWVVRNRQQASIRLLQVLSVSLLTLSRTLHTPISNGTSGMADPLTTNLVVLLLRNGELCLGRISSSGFPRERSWFFCANLSFTLSTRLNALTA